MEDKKTLAEATSLEEFKELRHAKSEPTAEPKEPKTPASEQAPSEIVAAPESAKPEAQEKEKPKERTLESRIKQLRDQGKHSEADKILREAWVKEEKARGDRLEQELQEFRTRKPAVEPEKPAPQPVAADRGPKVEDYDGSGPGKLYEDYLVDRASWKLEQKSNTEHIRQQQETIKQTINRRIAEARAAKSDFDAVAGSVNLAFDNNQAARFFAGIENSADVLYHLGQNPEEVSKLVSMDVESRLMQLAVIGYTLRTPAAGKQDAPPPAPLKTPVSKAPAPGRQLSAVEPPPKKSTAEAENFEEFKRIRRGA